MARTTATLVGSIIEVDASIDLTPFIDTANLLVTEYCTPETAGCPGDFLPLYSDVKLELIERWLSAHFYAVRDARTTAEKAGSVGASYEGETGQGFAFTRYGQQAMRLDTHGGLAALDAQSQRGVPRRQVGMFFVGRRRHHHHGTH